MKTDKKQLTTIRTRHFILKLNEDDFIEFSYNGKKMGVPASTIPFYLEKAIKPKKETSIKGDLGLIKE